MEISPSELNNSRTTDGESNIREKNSSFSLIEEGYDIEKVMTESGAFSSIESELEIAGDDCDNSEEDLKRLASSLAPRVSALLESNEIVLENLLNLTEKAWKEEEEDFEKALGQSLIYEDEHMNNSGSLLDNGEELEDESDGIRVECDKLSAAEQALREELEMSTLGFSYMVGRNIDYANINDENEQPIISTKLSYEQNLNNSNDKLKHMNLDETIADDENGDFKKSEQTQNGFDIDVEVNVKTAATPSSSYSKWQSKVQSSTIKRKLYTLYDHADTLSLKFDPIDAGHPTCPLLRQQDIPNLDPLLPTNPQVVDSHNEESMMSVDLNYTMARETDDSIKGYAVEEILPCTREYIKPMSFSTLSKIYGGLVGEQGDEIICAKGRLRRQIQKKGDESCLEKEKEEVCENQQISGEKQRKVAKVPVRTCMIRIRPDVLCGAVMDAVYASVQSLGGEMTKRQGGHFRGIIPAWINDRNQTMKDKDAMIRKSSSSIFSFSFPREKEPLMLPPFVIDAQLCSRKKSREFERILLIRVFLVEHDTLMDNGTEIPSTINPSYHSLDSFSPSSEDLDSLVSGKRSLLREAATLVQRIEDVSVNGGSAVLAERDQDFADEIVGTPITNNNLLQTPQHQIKSSLREHKGTPKIDTHSRQVGNMISSPIPFIGISRSDEEATRALSLSATQKDDSKAISAEKSIQKKASNRLMRFQKSTPSVKDDEDTVLDPIPSLSNNDWPCIVSSWRFLKECLSELNDRNLAYSTLVSCPFGLFPSLPTLDVQYCSQIKMLCRENMILSLLRAAGELEQYASESEFSCANLIQLLKPTFGLYKLEIPPLPQPIPLASYPMEFQSPEAICPPWGQKVHEALNLVAAKSSYKNQTSPTTCCDLSLLDSITPDLEKKKKEGYYVSINSKEYVNEHVEFCRANKAVSMVLEAFQRQDDEELAARLQRKNLQIMDRLSKMQALKRESVIIIRDSYGSNILASKAADSLNACANKLTLSSYKNKEEIILRTPDQVPLLQCRILMGSSIGRCYITAQQIFLVTQQIPIIGGSMCRIYSLADIEIKVCARPSSILSRLPASVSIIKQIIKEESQKIAISFIPSIGARRFQDFIKILKEIATENSEALNIDTNKGLLHIFDERKSVEKAALGLPNSK